jgi:ABC-type antimicrobial peptide transport system ATPase subunit
VAEVVEIGDQVIVLNEGRVVEQGSPLEVTLAQND